MGEKKKEGEWTGEKGRVKSFAPSRPSRLSMKIDWRGVWRRNSAEREKVILIIIIAVCVQSLWLCVFFLRDLVAELSIQYSFWCLSSVVRFVPYLGKILTEVIDEDADDSKSRLIYFIIGFRLGWKKGLINRSLHSLPVFAFLHSRFVTASIDEYRKNLLFVW